MAPAPPGTSALGFSEEVLRDLHGPMKGLLVELLLHKSVFTGDWFQSLAAKQDRAETTALLRIAAETISEGVDAGERLREWNALPYDAARVETLVNDLRRRLLESLIAMKEGSTEAFLAAGMQAPNAALRERLTLLADIDRRHADDLRGILGTRALPQRLAARQAARDGRACGAHDHRFAAGPLGHSIETTLHNLREKGATPARLVLSPLSLRHLRDEGRLDPGTHEALGLPVDVDLSWEGETFAIITRERVSLAEILTATRGAGFP